MSRQRQLVIIGMVLGVLLALLAGCDTDGTSDGTGETDTPAPTNTSTGTASPTPPPTRTVSLDDTTSTQPAPEQTLTALANQNADTTSEASISATPTKDLGPTQKADPTQEAIATQTAYALTDPALEGVSFQITDLQIPNSSDEVFVQVQRDDPANIIASYEVLVIDVTTGETIRSEVVSRGLRNVQSVRLPAVTGETDEDVYYVIVALDSTGEVIAAQEIIDPANTSGVNDDTATPEPTTVEMTFSAQGADTPTPLPVTPAPGNARERDEIGDGEVFLFYNNEIEPDRRTRVELQVFFRNLYITATPTSPVTVMPVTPFSSPPPVDPDAGQSPPVARLSEDGVLLFPQMVAELDCLDGFTNCGTDGPLRMQINRVNTFSWSILPVDDGTRGPRDLEITLYNADADGQPTGAAVWRRRFSIDVGIASSGTSPLPVLIAGVLALIFIIGGVTAIRRGQNQPTNGGKDAANIPAEDRPTVFVSYRRSVSWGIARTIVDRLESKGADVFIDVEDIHDGSFGEYIQQNIRDRDYFIPVLAPGTLESEWVQREIRLALTLDKTIIPVMVNGFDLYTHPIPDDLQAIKDQNGVILPPEYVDAGIDRIAKFIGL